MRIAPLSTVEILLVEDNPGDVHLTQEGFSHARMHNRVWVAPDGETALRMLVGRRMDVFVMHVLSPEEIDPPLRGDRRLIDVEDGDAAEITINAYAIERYKETVRSFISSVKTFCNRRSIVYIPVQTETPVETIVTKYLRERGVVR